MQARQRNTAHPQRNVSPKKNKNPPPNNGEYVNAIKTKGKHMQTGGEVYRKRTWWMDLDLDLIWTGMEDLAPKKEYESTRFSGCLGRAGGTI